MAGETRADKELCGDAGLLPFRNPDLCLEGRLADLLGRLSFDEKISLLGETAPGIPRLGIRPYNHGNEALHGVVRPGKFTVFPRPIGLAATFHPAMIEDMADCVSDEARARYNELGGEMIGGQFEGKYNGLLTFWSPTVNMVRDPRWGRTGETYGEDPLLTSRMGAAFVRGLQGHHPVYIKAVSTPKHFAANNEEHNRFVCKAVIPERSLREYYLQGFRGCIEQGGADSIMAAYNAINGVPCSANPLLLTQILRHEWGFRGYVVGDMWSPALVRDGHHYTDTWEQTAAACLRAGLDLDSGFGPFSHMREAIAQGLCSDADVDQAVRRVLRSRFRLGMFDPPERVPFNKLRPSVVGRRRHRELALQLARESIVLLQNKPAVSGRQLLPLDLTAFRKIAVMGAAALTWRHKHYSCEEGSCSKPVTPLDGIKKAAGARRVKYVDWELCRRDGLGRQLVVPPRFLRAGDGEDTAHGLRGEYFRNKDLSGAPVATRTDAGIDFDRTGHAPDAQFAEAPLSVRWTGRIIPPVTGEYEFCLTADDGVRMWIDGRLVIDAWRLQAATEYTAKVSLTAKKAVPVVIEYFDAGGEGVAKLAWSTPAVGPGPDEGVEVARACDLVVAVMGMDSNDAGEGKDKTDLDLPGGQREFLQRIAAVNPNIILVLMSDTSLDLSWEKANIPVIVEAWFPGEATGTALADVLFGRYNPAGRLPLTFYDGVRQLPPFDNYDVERGRTYQYLAETPLFAFGHGLSYTRFEYAGLRILRAGPDGGTDAAAEVKTAGLVDTVLASVRIRNAGERDGDEVVQVYVRYPSDVRPQPRRRLAGFERCHIKAGEELEVLVAIRMADIARWDESTHGWRVARGAYTIEVGAASDDIRLSTQLTVG